MPISSIAGSYGGCMFSYFKTCQTAFQSDSTILHPHQQWMNDPVSSQACQHLIEIILNLYINLGKIEIFAMLSLSIHEHGMSLHWFQSFTSFIIIFQFSIYKSYICFIRLIPMYFTFEWLQMLFLESNFLLLKRRNKIDFFMLTLNPVNLLNLIVLGCFLKILWALGHSKSSSNRFSFISSFLICMPSSHIPFLALFLCLELPALCWKSGEIRYHNCVSDLREKVLNFSSLSMTLAVGYL